MRSTRDVRFAWPGVLALCLIADNAVFGGRRSELAFLALLGMTIHTVVLGRQLNRVVVVSVVCAGLVFLSAVSAYRASLSHQYGVRSGLMNATRVDLSKLTLANFTRELEKTIYKKPAEAIVCCMTIGVAQSTGSFD